MKFNLFLTLIGIFLISSCNLLEKPKGNAEITSIVTEVSDSESSCTVYLRIKNTGSVKIYSSTISIFVETDLNEYYKSQTTNSSIVPGGAIYISMYIKFNDNAEECDSDSIIEQFYE